MTKILINKEVIYGMVAFSKKIIANCNNVLLMLVVLPTTIYCVVCKGYHTIFSTTLTLLMDIDIRVKRANSSFVFCQNIGK